MFSTCPTGSIPQAAIMEADLSFGVLISIPPPPHLPPPLYPSPASHCPFGLIFLSEGLGPMSPTSLSLPLCVCLSLSPSLCTLSLSTSLCLSLSLSLYPFSLPLCVCLSLSLYVCISLSLTLSLSELSLSTSNLSLSTSLCLSISISRALSTVFKSSLFPANSHMILTLSLPLSFYPLLFCRIPHLDLFPYSTI